MKFSFVSALLGSILLSVPCVEAENYCSKEFGFNVSDFVCNYCGVQAFYFTVQCGIYNTTFDTLPLGPLKNDQKVDFTNWQVVAGNQTTEFPHLQPYSPPNYGKLPAGKVGVFSYEEGGPEGGGGYLVSFYYGCACPLTGAPVSCTVTLLRTCYATTSTQPPITNEPYTLSYTATSNGSLTLSQTFPRKYWCLNDTLVATSLLGTPVDLYIDEYIHAEARKEA